MSMFPAGKYYVGDLCYAIDDSEWDDFCRLTIDGERVLDGEFPWKGSVLYSHCTAYGDGIYIDNHGREYSVDAGLIGVLPAHLVSKDEYGDFADPSDELGHIIEFTEPFECYYDGGTFVIGDIEIPTGDALSSLEDCNEE
jgi:hypothetical protein